MFKDTTQPGFFIHPDRMAVALKALHQYRGMYEQDLKNTQRKDDAELDLERIKAANGLLAELSLSPCMRNGARIFLARALRAYKAHDRKEDELVGAFVDELRLGDGSEYTPQV